MLILLNCVWILLFLFKKKYNVVGIVYLYNFLYIYFKYFSVLMLCWNYVKEYNLLNCYKEYIIIVFNILKFIIWNKSYLIEVFLSWYYYNEKKVDILFNRIFLKDE